MEQNLTIIFEGIWHERSPILLIPLADERIMKQAGFADHEKINKSCSREIT